MVGLIQKRVEKEDWKDWRTGFVLHNAMLAETIALSQMPDNCFSRTLRDGFVWPVGIPG
jgi:hypothetical protein